ncbi:MAG: ABC transporter ATP-binding protein [Patescibacteria group bacterium]|nr:MAG: ABC transporter ATP-binding protein [Patescibacteria group bacterium]
MTKTIKVANLVKNYITYEKNTGFLASLTSFFHRKKKIVKAVSDISFEVEQGELIGFIGPNGAGKTTTLKCLVGLLYPDSGTVSVLGFNPFERKKEFLKQIAFVMGRKAQLYWDLPAMETYMLVRDMYQLSESEFKKNLNELCDLLDFHKYLNRPVRTLSLGQRMKAEIITNLVYKPKILFLDEPTIGLDVVMQDAIRDFLLNYNKINKATIILTSHYMEDIESVCDRILIIDHGKLIYDGSKFDLKFKYAREKEFNIRVSYKHKLDKARLSQFGKVLSYDAKTARILVDKDKVNNLIKYLVENYDIADLDIKEPDIKYVIKKVFTSVKDEVDNNNY